MGKQGEQSQLNKESQVMKGVIIILIAGILWGFSGTCAQFLFQEYGITPIYLTNIRTLFSGGILVTLSLIKERENMKRLLSDGRTLMGVFIFAILGILFNQLSYLEAIHYTNSGTATILQYIGPVLIMLVSCVMERRLPTKKEILALLLVIVGTWLLATHGDFTSLYITPLGLVWGLLSAVAAVLYTMIPIKLIREYGSIPVVGMGMLISGIALSFTNRFNGGPAAYDQRALIFLGIIIVFGTVIPYTAYLLGISLCGAVKGSMIASIEPVSATLCMVFWLGEEFFAIDFVGFVCIFTTIFLLAKGSESRQTP